MQKLYTLFSLAITLCRYDLQERFAGALLGTVWLFLWPLVQLTIYIVIFGHMMGVRLGIPGNAHLYSYGIYVAAGLLSWTCFAATLQRTSNVFVAKRQILSKVFLDLRVYPISICCTELIPFGAGLLLLSVFAFFSGWVPRTELCLYLFYALCMQQLLAMGLGLFFACIAVLIRDTLEAVQVALQIAFWFTPIVYHPSILPQWVRSLLQWNPMQHCIAHFQNCFVFGSSPTLLDILYPLLAAACAVALGLITLRHMEKQIRDAL